MSSNTYEDPILAKLRNLLNEHGPAELKGKYYLGDTFVVNKSSLPMCFISYEKQAVVDDASHSIETHSTVLINVVRDLTQDFLTPNKRSGSHMALVKMVAGRDSEHKLLSNSILSVLRRFQDESSDQLRIDLGTPTEIEYFADERGNNVFTNEALVRFVVRSREFVV